jgi:mono/diheme cytochrome c family protein
MSKTRRPSWGRLGQLGIVAAAAGAVVAFAIPGQSQERTGGELWSIGGCFNCHGNLAAGDGDPAYPAGPDLRRTGLTPEQLYETIACGRPSTPMPYNLRTAYTETACYGLPLGPAPVLRGADYTPEDLQRLVDFLVANVVGVTRITREYCAAFFGGNLNAPACAEY